MKATRLTKSHRGCIIRFNLTLTNVTAFVFVLFSHNIVLVTFISHQFRAFYALISFICKFHFFWKIATLTK